MEPAWLSSRHEGATGEGQHTDLDRCNRAGEGKPPLSAWETRFRSWSIA